MKTITQAELKKVVSYDTETGNFLRLDNPTVRVGYLHHGYVTIRINGKQYPGHRLAWLYVHGVWPIGDIDHINRVKDDNRIANLRITTRSENSANSTLYRAIRLLPSGFFEVTVMGVKLGPYPSMVEARHAQFLYISALPSADCSRKVRWNALTQKRLHKILSYDSTTGHFLWKENRGGTAYKGTRAGHIRPDGYVRMYVDGKLHYAHRLAWLYVHGESPTKEVDHINGDPSDNRIANLRLANHGQNIANSKLRTDNRAGFKGVTLLSDGTYVASLQSKGQKIVVGYFKSGDVAAAAYAAAAKRLFGEFARAS